VTARRRLVYLDDVLGRRVRTADGRVVGRIEEVRTERRANGEHEVVEYHLGTGALLERLAVVRSFLSPKPMLIARWDQIDIRRPPALVLTCAVDELRRTSR